MWKKRISDLVTKDSAQALATLFPEYQDLFEVGTENTKAESGLKPAEAEARILAALVSLFTTFGVRNKVYPLIAVLIKALHYRARRFTVFNGMFLLYPIELCADEG